MALLQGGKIRGVDQIIRQLGVFQKHHQVDGVVGDLAVDTDVAVVEHIGFGDGVGGVLQEIAQGGVLGVVLPGFDLQGQDLTGPLHEEVHLALLFAVEVVEVKAVGLQLLGGGVFVDGAEVDVLLPVQNFQLDARPCTWQRAGPHPRERA